MLKVGQFIYMPRMVVFKLTSQAAANKSNAKEIENLNFIAIYTDSP